MQQIEQVVVWRSCAGHTPYEVSSDGLVRSPSGLLKVSANGDGYLDVYLRGHGRRSVHRLVCTAFHGPCPPGHQVNHIDGNRVNARADNLEWVTPQRNIQHRDERLGVVRGTTINIYLQPNTRRAFSSLKARWNCTWGEVIARLIRERSK